MKIFAKYEIRIENENRPRRNHTIIKDEIILKKKEIYDQLKLALVETNKDIKDFFAAVDRDSSAEIDQKELLRAFRSMNL